MNKEDPAEQDIKSNKIKQGFLFMRSRILKQWKKRWIVLTKTHLYSFQAKGIYRSALQKISLREVSTIKSFYKNQYERSQVIRVESDDAYFYLSASEHQEKWAWMTSIQKITEILRNPNAVDSQNLVRQSLRMSGAVRTSNIARKSFISSNATEGNLDSVLKKMGLKLRSLVVDLNIKPKTKENILQVTNFQYLSLNQKIKSSKDIEANQKPNQSKVFEKIAQKVVQVQIPIFVEKIVYIQQSSVKQSNQHKQNGENLSDLFAVLINGKLEDPYPLLEFVAFLGLTGIDYYQNIAIKFCCQQNSHRFFAELILQVLNQETSEDRLNRFTGFIYILCQRQPDYFYASDIRILIQIVLRQLQLYRSDLNQMINLQVLKTLLTYHQNLLVHKKYDIQAIVSDIANLGAAQNKQLSKEICLLIQ